jgi:predicted lipid-binding transport protein (Tim44 family)
MDLLRGPALGMISMIILMAGVLIITVFAALIAQMSLLFRLRPWNTSEKRSETGKKGYPQETYAQRCSACENQQVSSQNRQRSPSEHPQRGQVVVEPNANEVIDAVWWETVKQ